MTTTAGLLVKSVEQIRSEFPALNRRISGRPVGYFDGPGGTQVPECVIAAMAEYLRHHNANTHWNYPTSAETDALIGEARQAVADFLNGRPEEVVFGPNMTTLTFHLARGLARGWLAGDEVVVTELDHHGNVGPWEAVALERALALRRIPFRVVDGTLDLGRLIDAIGPRTRLVAVGAASNALGTVTDVTAVCAAARERGAISFVDAVHSAPHVLPDVQAIGCDYLACSPYKFYGPHHGILWGRQPLLDAVDVPKVRPAPDTAPERLETGTQSHEAIAGTRAAIDFLASIAPRGTRRESLVAAYQVLDERGRRLFTRLWEGVGQIGSIRRFGPPPDRLRTPTLGFVMTGIASSQVARLLAGRGLFLSHGDFFAATVVERLGLGAEGLVRAGAACYTTDGEVDALLAALAELDMGKGKGERGSGGG